MRFALFLARKGRGLPGPVPADRAGVLGGVGLAARGVEERIEPEADRGDPVGKKGKGGAAAQRTRMRPQRGQAEVDPTGSLWNRLASAIGSAVRQPPQLPSAKRATARPRICGAARSVS